MWLYFGVAFVGYDLFFFHLVIVLMSSTVVGTKRVIREVHLDIENTLNTV